MSFAGLTISALAALQGSPLSGDPAAAQQVAAVPQLDQTDPQDDSVPLPIAAVVQPGADHDERIASSSGDPFFLGFAAGAFHPPAGESIDPALTAQLASGWDDGRPTPTTYAFVMFSKRITQARLAQLEALGVRTLGFHPHYCMKVALAPQLVEQVAALDFVRWVGAPKTWQKVHPALAATAQFAPPTLPLEVWIDVYESDLSADSTSTPAGTAGFGDHGSEFALEDSARLPQKWMSNGWQQRDLQKAGVEVLEYVDELRAFRARVLPTALETLTALDFVQFLELQPDPSPAHDESMPMILADGTRASWDGSTSSAVVGAQVDSGLEYSHQGIGSFYWWQNNYTAESGTDDLCGHGTHVAGTFHGDGDVEDSYIGVANGLGWGTTGRFFNVKIFSGAGCIYSGTSLATILAGLHSAVTDGSGNVTPRPHVINNSWGSWPAPSGGWIGSEASPREIDGEVYSYGQLQVWAAGNEGPGASSIRLEATAKNALTVGGVRDYASGAEDPGALYSGSSRGPCGDGRWKPNLCAPATNIRSADASTLTGYVNKTGTSMAAPHVSGLAAQLCDHFAFLRYNPPALGAVLMTTAMTKDDQLLTVPSTNPNDHLNTFGTGRIEALKANLMAPGTSLFFWSWGQGTSGYQYKDVTISNGATRLVVSLFYVEPACSAGASQALVNDLDLWIDKPPLSAGGNTGEYSAQQSSVDNVEIRILDAPAVGTWRLKVNTNSATSTSWVGLSAMVIYGDTTPDGTLSVSASDSFVKPNEDVAITATAANPSYIASAVYLDSTSSGDLLQDARMLHKDGATADLMNNQTGGRDLLLGDISAGDSRSATWTTRWATEGVKNWCVDARSDNWVDKSDCVDVTVDGTPPPLPTSLHSTTHTPSVWSNDANIVFAWTQPVDALSGVAGYSRTVQSTGALPDTTQDIGAVTSDSHLFNVLADSGTWWFNLRPVDKSGNWSPTYSRVGPFLLDFIQPNYMTGLISTSHVAGTYSCNPSVACSWDPGIDGGGSGMAGYSYVVDHAANSAPDDVIEIGNVTSTLVTLSPNPQPWYIHFRPVDNAGNGQNSFHLGPYSIVDPTPVVYCTGKTNSLGCVPSIAALNQPSKSAGNFTVTCTQVINNKSGHLFWGLAPSAVPFQGGFKCVAPPTQRTASIVSGGSAPPANDCTGSFTFVFSTAYMNALGIDPGDTLYAQWWMRDPASPSTTGLSNAIRFTVCQ